MIHYLLESSLCTIAFYTFYFLFLKDKQFHAWNRFYLIGTLVLSLIIPLLHIPIEEIIYVKQTLATQKPAQLVAQASYNWEAIVLYLYLIGATIFSFRFIRELFQIRKMICQSDKTEYPNFTIAQLNNDFPLCSFFNYIIASDSKQISAFEMDHELSHIEQFHSIDKLFIEFTKIILWFNPVVYFYGRSVHMTHEFLADKRVLAKHQTEDYLQFLIQSLSKQQTSLHTLNPFHSLIKNRLLMIKNKKESNKTLFYLAIPFIACLTIFMACEKTTTYVAEQDSITTQDTSAEYANLEFNEKGEVVFNDTIIVFNDQTFEEEVMIMENTMSLDEYENLQIEKLIGQSVNLMTDTENQTDLMTINRIDEHLNVITQIMTPADFQQYRKGDSENKNIKWEPFKEKKREETSDSDQKIVNHVFNQVPFEDNSILVTVVDTIIIFDDESYEETMKIVETKITLEEYEKRKKELEK